MSDKLLIDRKLLERLQERLDPHIDARDWGMVRDAFSTQARAAPEAELVEVVATVESYGGKWAGIHWGDCIGSTEDLERQLMTVAQHRRIMASAPQHDAELVELLEATAPYLELAASGAYEEQYPDRAKTERLLTRLCAKLATLSAKNEGGKA